MSATELILSVATWLALAVLAVAFLLTVWRVVKGPTLPDRVVALDMLVGIVIGFIALIAIRTGFTLYIDIAISLGLVGFLATVAFARFILSGAVGRRAAAGEVPLLGQTAPIDAPQPAGDVVARSKKTSSGASAGKRAAKAAGKDARAEKPRLSKVKVKTAGETDAKPSGRPRKPKGK